MRRKSTYQCIFVMGCPYVVIYMMLCCLSFWVLWIPYGWAIKDCNGPEDYAIYSKEYCDEQNARIWQELLDSDLFEKVFYINIVAIIPAILFILYFVYVEATKEAMD